MNAQKSQSLSTIFCVRFGLKIPYIVQTLDIMSFARVRKKIMKIYWEFHRHQKKTKYVRKSNMTRQAT